MLLSGVKPLLPATRSGPSFSPRSVPLPAAAVAPDLDVEAAGQAASKAAALSGRRDPLAAWRYRTLAAARGCAPADLGLLARPSLS